MTERSLKEKKAMTEAAAVYAVLFAAAAIGGFAVLFLEGRTLIWEKDGIGQYYPAFLYIGQYLRAFFADLASGHPALPLYDFSIGFGEDIIGTLNYYGFGDPFNLIAVFAAGSRGVFVYECLFFIRAFLAGFSLIAYLNTMGVRGWPASVSAVAYALCGFTIGGVTMYAEWGTVLVYFPLMLLASERIMRGRRGRFLMTAATALGALSGFYFLYMCSLALAVYVIARLIARNGVRAARENIFTCLTCLLYYILGIGLAAPILLPALDAYFSSQRSGMPLAAILGNGSLFKPVLNQPLISAIGQQVTDPEISLLTGIPLPESAAVLLLILSPAKLVPFTRRRAELLAALALAVTALSFPLTGYVFNGFGETNDRWVFLVYFLLSVITGAMLSDIRKACRRGTAGQRRRAVRPGAGRSAAFCGVVCAVMVFNIIYECFALFGGGGLDLRQEYLPSEGLNATYIDSPVALFEDVMRENEPFRITSSTLTGINGRPENVAMLNGYDGTNYWWSIVNGRTQAFVNLVSSLGYRWRSFGLNNDPSAETAAGARYYVTNDRESVPAGYEEISSAFWNGSEWKVYGNPFYDGMAYLRDPQEAAAAWSRTVGEGSPDETEALVEEAHHRNPDDPWDKSGVDGSSFRAYLDEMAAFRREAEAGAPGGRSGVEAFSIDRKKSRVTIEVTADEGDQLVAAVPFSKNWRAAVDGRKTAAHDTDVMFTAIDGLSAGTHTITLTYVPGTFYAGLGLFAAAAAAAIGMAIMKRRRGELK